MWPSENLMGSGSSVMFMPLKTLFSLKVLLPANVLLLATLLFFTCEGVPENVSAGQIGDVGVTFEKVGDSLAGGVQDGDVRALDIVSASGGDLTNYGDIVPDCLADGYQDSGVLALDGF